MTNPVSIAFEKGYRVSECGTLVTSASGRKLNPTADGCGYFRFAVIIDGKRSMISVHRLQAFQKFGEAVFGDDVQVRHLDSNRQNNSRANIEIGNRSENMMDKPVEVRRRAAAIATAKIRKHDPQVIREHFALCGSRSETMRHFGITSTGTLHYVLKTALTPVKKAA